MSNNKLKISVVTVCYNAVDAIGETMLSILNQTYPNIEYIIIDGGSTDGSVDIINKYADRVAYWVSEPDKGIYDAMNKGIVAATGDYIIFMNAGDTFYSNCVVEESIKKISGSYVYYGDALFFNPKNKRRYGGIFSSYRLTKENICHQSIFYPLKELKNRNYDLNYRILADWDMNLYLWRRCKFIYLEILISRYDTDGISGRVIDENFNRSQKKRIYRELGFAPLLYHYWMLIFYKFNRLKELLISALR